MKIVLVPSIEAFFFVRIFIKKQTCKPDSVLSELVSESDTN